MGSFGRAAVIAALLVGVLAVSVSIGGGLAYLVERAASAPEPNAPPIAAAVAASPPRPDPRLETVIAALERSEARLQAALDLLTARAIPPTPFERFLLAQSDSRSASRPDGAGFVPISEGDQRAAAGFAVAESPRASKMRRWRAKVRTACDAAPLK